MAETQKEKLMRLLGVSAEEAEDIIRTDKDIDQGKRVAHDLDPEKEKEAKKMANVHEKRKPMVLDHKPRERKANPTKGGIIAELAKFLQENGEIAFENVEIANKERQITFTVGENTFDLTLIQKRKPKN